MTTQISYHPQTGITLGPVTLSVSPLEPDAVISQAYATPKPLPAVPAGHVACYLDVHGAPPYSYTDGDWAIQRDWRDTPLYQHDGQRYTLGEIVDGRAFGGLGNLPDWLVATAPPAADQVWDGQAWQADATRQAHRLQAQRDAALATLPSWEQAERAAGIDHAGQRWLTTPAALQDIRDVLLAGAVPDEQWVTADRQVLPMTLPGLQALWQAVTARGATIYRRRLAMEAEIETMDVEQLQTFAPA